MTSPRTTAQRELTVRWMVFSTLDLTIRGGEMPRSFQK
jgi:hypothetical protein